MGGVAINMGGLGIVHEVGHGSYFVKSTLLYWERGKKQCSVPRKYQKIWGGDFRFVNKAWNKIITDLHTDILGSQEPPPCLLAQPIKTCKPKGQFP